MGLLSANLKALLGLPSVGVAPILTISLADGSTYRLAGVTSPIASSALGYFDHRVTQWGRWPRALSGRDGGVVAATGSVTLDDTDRAVSSKAYMMRGGAATVKLASPQLGSAADYFTLFVGVVSAISRDGNGWAVQFRTDDAWLQSNVPKATFTSSAWTSLDPSALGKPIPIIYGVHDATGGLGSNGMVPAYYVDTVGFRFVVAGHYLKAVRRVYLNGTLKTLTTDYTVQFPVVGGRQYTVIQFTSNPGANPVVTCDVEGIEDVGNGTGALITNPATQLKHFLVNFVKGEYTRGGGWAADATTPVDVTHFTTCAAFFDAMGQRGCRWIGDDTRTGEAELTQWCSDFDISSFWANSGKLGVLPFDQRNQNADIYPPDRIIESLDVMRGEMAPSFDSEAYVARIQTRYIPRSVDGTYLQEREDWYTLSSATAVFAKEARWFPAEVGYYPETRDAAARRINRWSSLLPAWDLTLRPQFLDQELMTDVGVTGLSGLNEDGSSGWEDKTWQRRTMRVVSTEADLDAMEVRIRLQDLHRVLTSFSSSWRVRRTTSAGQDWTYLLNVLGGGLAFSRASKKWVDDPGGNLVLECAVDALPADAKGFLIEEASTNDILHSAFDAGLTGWTVNAFNGSIVVDTGDLLFDPGITANSIKITSPNTALTGNCVINQSTASYAANTHFTVSVDHKDETGQQISVFIQRSVDSFFWNEGTRTWGAAGTANKLPLSQFLPARNDLRNIDLGGSASLVTVFVGIDSATAVNNQSHHVYHVQPERQRWASSRIVTGFFTAVTRAAETLLCANDGAQSKEIWPNTRGTIGIFGVTPLWNAADLAAGSLMYLLDLAYDGSNRWEVFYDKDAALWKFRLTLGGGPVTATAPGTPALGVAQSLAVRWTSVSDAELGLAGGTASILVNGVRGTDAVLGGSPIKVASQNVYFGGKTGAPMTNQWNGTIEGVRISPFCLSDAIINARLGV